MAYALGTIGGFGELINSGVKKLALSEVLPPAEMDRLLPDAEQMADVFARIESLLDEYASA